MGRRKSERPIQLNSSLRQQGPERLGTVVSYVLSVYIIVIVYIILAAADERLTNVSSYRPSE